MSESEQKYMSPAVILPLETSSYVEFDISANFEPLSVDLLCTGDFVNPNYVGSATAKILSGTASAVVVDSSLTALTSTVTNTGSQLQGFQFSGDGDGVYCFYINGILTMRFTTNIMVPNIIYTFPVAIPVGVGQTLSVVVTNTCDVTCDYTAAIIGLF